MNKIFPNDEMAITHILVVEDLEESKSFYRGILGAEIHREYGGTSCVFQFLGTWLLIVTGGGPTPDKPNSHFVPPPNTDRISHVMTIRVPDCRMAYEVLKERGAEFITPPLRLGP